MIEIHLEGYWLSMMEYKNCIRVVNHEYEGLYAGFDPVPMSLEDWIEYKSNSVINLELVGGSCIESVRPELAGKKVDLKAPIHTQHTNQCIALTAHGWLPPFLAIQDATVLPDKNIISDFSQRFSGGQLISREGSAADFIDWICEEGYHATLSMVPFALEANKNRRPTREEVLSQLVEAGNKIRSCLPNMSIGPSPEQQINGIMGLLEESQVIFEQRFSFLMEVAPDLGSNAGLNRRMSIWRKIFDTADRYGLDRKDICVLAAISCVSAEQGCNPARGVLKPKKAYTEKLAYNALADIQLLSLFMNAVKTFPDKKTILLTKDIDLAKFWLGIMPRVEKVDEGKISCSMTLSPRLFALDASWLEVLKQEMEKPFS